MFKQVITDWLDAQNLNWKDSGSGYILCQCPNPTHNDKHESAFCSTNEGWISCKACGHYVSPKTFISEDSNLQDLLLASRFNSIIHRLEEKFHKTLVAPKTFSLPPYSAEVGEYRGLSAEFMETIGAYKCNNGRFADRIMFPFYNADGELKGYTGRYVGSSTDKSIPKYMHSTGIEPSNHILFGEIIKELELDTSELIVTEGSQDALCLLAIGIAATPSLGFRTPNDSWVIEAIELGVDKVILAWDNDNTGMDKMVGEKNSLYSKWQDKIPTELGLFHKKTKWLYSSTFKDFGEAYEEVLPNGTNMLQLMMNK